MRSHIQARAWPLAARVEARRCASCAARNASTTLPEGGDLPSASSALGASTCGVQRVAGAPGDRECSADCDLRRGARRGVGVEVGLVDDDQVGQLHHALLDRLQVVAGVGQLQQHEHVGHAGDRGLALADADGLDDRRRRSRRPRTTSIASRVFSATPPSVPPPGSGG